MDDTLRVLVDRLNATGRNADNSLVIDSEFMRGMRYGVFCGIKDLLYAHPDQVESVYRAILHDVKTALGGNWPDLK